MNRTKIINSIINKYQYKTYLEIGCAGNRNFKRIKLEDKIGVDPRRGGTIRKTSDDFFKDNNKIFDIIFIDGLHHSDQVYRDIINSLNFLKINGTIVVHDCNPVDHRAQIIPRPSNQKQWNGDVWKAWAKLRCERDDLEMFVIDADHGCGIIRIGKQEKLNKIISDFHEFELNKSEILNLKTIEYFTKWLT